MKKTYLTPNCKSVLSIMKANVMFEEGETASLGVSTEPIGDDDPILAPKPKQPDVWE